MAKARNDILFRYLADTKGLERGNKRVRKSMGGVTDTAKKLGGALALAFGAREVLQFGVDAVNSASDFEESVNAVEVATGLAARQIKALGETAATELGLSKTAVNEAAVAFAAFGEKINANDVGGVFDEFIGRATDFASVMNLDVDEALTKFQSGLAGETEPLRRFGIDISAASVKLFAMENGIGNVGRELSETEKVQARYGLLLKETNKFQGDFANTLDSTANQQKVLNAEIENAKIELGDKLMPVYNDFLKLSRELLPLLEGQIDEVADLVDSYKGLRNALAGVIDLNASRMFADLETTTESVFVVLKNLVPTTRILDFAITKLTGSSLGFNEAAKATNTLLLTTRDITDQYGSGAVGLAEDLVGAADAQDDLTEAVRRFEVPGAFDAFVTSINNIRKALNIGLSGEGGGGGKVGLLAHGGTIQPGGSAIVGENGPEFISPRGGAKITPMRGQNGGGGTTVNVTFSGVVGDPVAVAEQIQDLLDLNSRVNGPGI